MSRIANSPVKVPDNVQATLEANKITVKGPLGTLEQDLNPNVTISLDDGELVFAQANDSRDARAMAGTMRSLVNNMVVGVSTGFERKLNLVGVGFRAQLQGNDLKLQLGYSHDIVYSTPEGITIQCPNQTEVVVKGINKQVVGQVAAEIRSFRRPEPYKGKGVRYADEHVALKEAKKK